MFDFAGFFPPKQYRTDRLLGGGLLALVFPKAQSRAKREGVIRCAVGEVNLSDFCKYYQQPTNNTPELALQIGSRRQQWPLAFRFATSLISLHSQWLLHIVISQQSAAILVLFVGRRYYLRPVSRFAAFAAFSVALAYSDIAAAAAILVLFVGRTG